MQTNRLLTHVFCAGLMLAGLAGTASAATITFTDNTSIVNQLTDFRSGGAPGVPSVSFLNVPTFDSSLGVLQSVRITSTISFTSAFTAKNNSAGDVSGSAAITVSNGAFAQGLSELGGTFGDPVYANVNGNSFTPKAFGYTGNTPFFDFGTLAPGQSGSTTQSGFASRTATYNVAGFTGNGGVENPTITNYFDRSANGGVTDRNFGAQTRTGTLTSTFGGNFDISQTTTASSTFSVEYTYQPVPAPPAAISLGIGGLVGLISTGATKIRRRRIATKK